MWVTEDKGITQVGFEILYSPDDARLRDFVAYLQEMNEDDEE